MSGENDVRIFYEDPAEPGLFLIEDTSSAVTLANIGSYVRGVAGVGNPYYVYSNAFSFGFNPYDGYTTDWSGAPICNTNPAVNSADIMAMLDNPPVGKIVQA